MGIVWRLLAVLTLTAGLAYLPAQESACACSCVAATEERRRETAAMVFVGAVSKVEKPGGPDNGSDELVTYTFQVERMEKGVHTAEIVLTAHTSEGACGTVFRPGARYRIFATASGETNICMGNRSLAVADETPRPSPAYPPEKENGDVASYAGVAVLAFAAATVSFYFYRKLRSRR